MKLKFTQTRLNSMLDDIQELYAEGLSIDESIETVKEAYKGEIETLEVGPVWIKEGDRSEHSA